MNISDRSVIEGELWVPGETTLLDGQLLFRGTRSVKPIHPEMLQEFMEVGITGEESALVIFARKYGPIGLCRHGIPYGHNRQSYARKFQVMDCEPVRLQESKWEYAEPIATWFKFARQAHAVLSCSARLHEMRRPPAEELRIAYPDWFEQELREPPKPNLETSRAIIAGAINTWIFFGGLRPQFAWGRKGCSVLFGTGDYTSLFGALAAQLMLGAAMTDGWVTCSDCGMPYAPARRPNPNRRRFCPECGLRAAWRASKRKLRGKN
jgi:hypothetical protein